MSKNYGDVPRIQGGQTSGSEANELVYPQHELHIQRSSRTIDDGSHERAKAEKPVQIHKQRRHLESLSDGSSINVPDSIHEEMLDAENSGKELTDGISVAESNFEEYKEPLDIDASETDDPDELGGDDTGSYIPEADIESEETLDADASQIGEPDELGGDDPKHSQEVEDTDKEVQSSSANTEAKNQVEVRTESVIERQGSTSDDQFWADLWLGRFTSSVDVSTIKITLVMTYCNGDLEWLKEYSEGFVFERVFVAVKCGINPEMKDLPDGAEIVPFPNVGGCDHTMAFYMTEILPNLPSSDKNNEMVLFLKDNMFSRDELLVFRRLERMIEVAASDEGFACAQVPSRKYGFSFYHKTDVLQGFGMPVYVRATLRLAEEVEEEGEENEEEPYDEEENEQISSPNTLAEHKSEEAASENEETSDEDKEKSLVTVQGEEMKKKEIVNENKREARATHEETNGESKVDDSKVDPAFKSSFENLGAWHEAMGIRLPSLVTPVCYGGMYMVKRSKIDQVSRDILVRILNSVSRGNNIEEGHFAERTWAGLFSNEVDEERAIRLLEMAAMVFPYPDSETGDLMKYPVDVQRIAEEVYGEHEEGK